MASPYKGERKVLPPHSMIGPSHDPPFMTFGRVRCFFCFPDCCLRVINYNRGKTQDRFQILCACVFFLNSHHLKSHMYKILQSRCHPSFSLQLNVRPKSALYILAQSAFLIAFSIIRALKRLLLSVHLYIFSVLSFTSEEIFFQPANLFCFIDST